MQVVIASLLRYTALEARYNRHLSTDGSALPNVRKKGRPTDRKKVYPLPFGIIHDD
jgi:hypothetical protein